MNRLVFSTLLSTLFRYQGASGAQQVLVNPEEINSPWPGFHAGPARQASSLFPGPSGTTLYSYVHYFANDTPDGKDLGTSPWHILSNKRYKDDADSRTLWGASLQYLYKYKVTTTKGLEYVHSYRLIPESVSATPYIPWNFVGLADGRIVVPMPNGLRRRSDPCYGQDPSLLVFRDESDAIDSNIECVHKFEFTSSRLQEACGFSTHTEFSSFTFQAVLFSGDIVVKVVHKPLLSGRSEMWLLVLDNNLEEIRICDRVSRDGTSTNAFALEPTGVSGETRFYVTTEKDLIQVLYSASENRLTVENAVEVGYRGRTGTTPTLLGIGGNPNDQWIITVDGRCYVDDVFQGSIVCDGNTEPSALIAIPRPLERSGDHIHRVNLPGFVNAVENSPAVSGNDIVVCSYSGYTADGPLDGMSDFALGIVKLSWNPSTRDIQVDWEIDDVQCSGIPTISTSSNLVYFSGADPDDEQTYFRAVRLNTDSNGPGGEIVAQKAIGPALGDNAVYDAGNSLIINDDGTAIFPAGNSLVQLSNRMIGSSPDPDDPSRPSICYSGSMKVRLIDGREISMKEVQVGDMVQVSGDRFEPVYSMCKRNHTHRSVFIQIYFNELHDPVEVSGNHLIFVMEGKFYKAKAASALKIGDLLVLSDGSTTAIVAIGTVVRTGYFSPYTYSGTLVVNGVLTSVYAQLPGIERSSLTKYLPQHQLYHIAHTHHRLLCMITAASCSKETYDETGMSNIVKMSLELYVSWLSIESPSLQFILGFVVGIYLACIYVIELALSLASNVTGLLIFALACVFLFCKKS